MLLSVAAVAFVLSPTSTASAPVTAPEASLKRPGCPTLYTRHDFRQATGRALRAPPYTAREKRRLKRRLRCQANPAGKPRLRRWLKRKKQAYRVRRAAARLTPYLGPHGTRWAIPWRIVACESGGNFRAYNGVLGAGGAYQIIPSTWAGYGGRRFAAAAHVASPYAQHVVASRIWAGGRGRGQWAC